MQYHYEVLAKGITTHHGIELLHKYWPTMKRKQHWMQALDFMLYFVVHLILLAYLLLWCWSLPTKDLPLSTC